MSRYTLEPNDVRGLYTVRSGVSHAVAAERMKIQQAAHDSKGEVVRIKQRLLEQKSHLKFLVQKCAEKTKIHEKNKEEYELAHELYLASRREGSTSDPDQVRARRAFQAMFETLDGSWFKTLDIIQSRCSSNWAFKVKRQNALIERLTQELAEAENKLAAVQANIDADLNHLQARSDFLDYV